MVEMPKTASTMRTRRSFTAQELARRYANPSLTWARVEVACTVLTTGRALIMRSAAMTARKLAALM